VSVTDKLLMRGAVLCPSCGGQVLSMSGKAMLNSTDMTLACWECHAQYPMQTVFDARRENEVVTLPKSDAH
jgi:hypothetical protein